ncbi:MAG: dihydroorotate dehydrogenase electron transfer subunit [Anaerolineae bacterium]|nr:dihydroorotate dehydrogenase electron transfer subunit [Anaerolineae bacterium]
MIQTSLPAAAHIIEIADESATVRTLALDRSLEADPGQFVMVWLPGIDEKPFSLVRADPVTLTIARVGPFTTQIYSLRAGDSLWLRGPLGRGFALPPQTAGRRQGSILLVAGGYGVAPLHFLAERALASGWEVSAAVGARTAADLIFHRRLAALGAEVHVTTDDGSLGEQGLATKAAERLITARGGRSFKALYACGPEPMLAAVERLAQAHRMPAQLSYERYMRCGFGVCGSCAREGWLVCSDGPVRSIPAVQDRTGREVLS